MQSSPSRAWFESRLLILLLILVAAVPLVMPSVPPLSDLPGHIGRYKIELDLARSPSLQQWYSFRWALFGNLAVDLLIVPLSHLLPLEAAVKLIVLMIPSLTVAGMLYLAREIHGRIPPTAFLALPLAYSFPFQLGFVNFTLAMALAFLGAGLWLHLGRLNRTKVRAASFAIFSIILFLAHAVAWAIFGVMLFAAELVARRQRSLALWQALRDSMMAMLPLATPVILIVNWAHQDPAGMTVQVPWQLKLYQMKEVLRDRIFGFDILSAILLYAIALLGLRQIGVRYNPRLGLAALLLLIAYCVTPGVVKGVYYADARILPYALAVALLALSPVAELKRWHHAIAGAAILLFAIRMASQTVTYHQLDRHYQEQLAALAHIHRGARVFVAVEAPCNGGWNLPRTEHLGSLAIARREAYANGMWPMPGGRLMSIIYDAAGPFKYSSSQILLPEKCRSEDVETLPGALKKLPREAFDYVWLIDLPPAHWPRTPWLKPVWHAKTGILFRIVRNPLTTSAARSD